MFNFPEWCNKVSHSMQALYKNYIKYVEIHKIFISNIIRDESMKIKEKLSENNNCDKYCYCEEAKQENSIITLLLKLCAKEVF